MKKLYTLGVCFLLCLFLPFLSKADTLEIAGAEMTYKWISGNTYEASLNIYTTCNSVTLDSVWIKVSSPDAGFKSYQKLAKLENIGKVRKTCITQSTCENVNNPLPGFWKWTATAEFTLSRKNYCRYIFNWDTCCRTKIITTGPALNHFYIDAYMRICEDSTSSSPYFTENPFFTSAINYCNEKRNTVAGANDKNFDYKFELTAPKQSINSNVIFNSGYSFMRPFFWSASSARPCSDLKINDTGMVSFKSPHEDKSVVAFNLSKYDKNGVLQSRINRDIMYMLMGFSENRSPIISGINGGNQTRFIFYANQSQCFTIHTFDVDDADSVSLSYPDLPVGATFNIETGKKYPEGTFCWTPDSNQIRNEPYIFTVNAVDNNYGCSDIGAQGKSSRSFSIYICTNSNDCVLGIEDGSISKELHIYPQPAQNAVYVEFPEYKVNNLQIKDMTGRIFSPNYIWEGNKLKIDLADLKHGSYLLEIITPKNIYHNKLIIQK